MVVSDLSPRSIKSVTMEPMYIEEGMETKSGEPMERYDDPGDKKLLRKLDLHLIPTMTLLYLLSYLDRVNIGQAKIDGLMESLKLSSAQYNACLSVFFATYVIFEIPSNLVLKRLRPSRWIPMIMISWGIVMTLMGLVNSYGSLIACRLLLGAAESGLFPGLSLFFQARLEFDRILVRCGFLPFQLVQTTRTLLANQHPFLCRGIGRRLWWYSRLCHQSNERHRWTGRMAMDLLYRRHCDGSRRSTGILFNQWFSIRSAKISHRRRMQSNNQSIAKRCWTRCGWTFQLETGACSLLRLENLSLLSVLHWHCSTLLFSLAILSDHCAKSRLSWLSCSADDCSTVCLLLSDDDGHRLLLRSISETSFFHFRLASRQYHWLYHVDPRERFERQILRSLPHHRWHFTLCSNVHHVPLGQYQSAYQTSNSTGLHAIGGQQWRSDQWANLSFTRRSSLHSRPCDQSRLLYSGSDHCTRSFHESSHGESSSWATERLSDWS